MRVCFPILLLGWLLCAHPAWPSVAPLSREVQRQAFVAALAAAEAGRWQDVEPFLENLQDYPLLPDLRAAWLNKRLGDNNDRETADFLQRYPDLGFSGSLRLNWAMSLAERRRWDEFLSIYEDFYADRQDTKLDCLALRARINTGRDAGVADRAMAIWLYPFSRPKACDPVLAWLEDKDLITAERRRERIDLALEAGQVQLARYLARPLGPADQAKIERWSKMRANPARELAAPQRYADTPENRRLLAYGIARLASQNPEAADQLWPAFSGFGFEPDQRLQLQRRITLGLARNFLPGGRQAIERQAAIDDDPIVAQWRVRLALRDGDWTAVLDGIEQLPADTGNDTNWDYWRARAMAANGLSEAAEAQFQGLADERGYYSFLSADNLQLPYVWSDVPTPVEEPVIAQIAEQAEFVRLQELFLTGLQSRARIEWTRAVEKLPPDWRDQAAILALRWGGYSSAISTAARSGQTNDLALRYPLPWRAEFERLSQAARVDPALAYGVARSESLFMPDVASAAGAIGLMQLMPGTGKETAAQASIPWRGWHSLTDPQTNITLGTRYLAKMLDRFDNNPVLATAAYNAGPNRVQAWLPTSEPLAADAWVDSIPFRETRGYVRRVLASDVMFEWRMNGTARQISERMPPVLPAQD